MAAHGRAVCERFGVGEDPLLAGTLSGEVVRGTQDEHVISTVKHFALNAKETNRPQFPFGYGQSYTHFEYSNLKVAGGKGLSVSFDVQNAGSRDGADVLQFYLSSAAGQATLRLIGFTRVSLKAGETTRVSSSADLRLLSRFDEKTRQWSLAAGRYEASVGHSSTDFALHDGATLHTSTPRP